MLMHPLGGNNIGLGCLVPILASKTQLHVPMAAPGGPLSSQRHVVDVIDDIFHVETILCVEIILLQLLEPAPYRQQITHRSQHDAIAFAPVRGQMVP